MTVATVDRHAEFLEFLESLAVLRRDVVNPVRAQRRLLRFARHVDPDYLIPPSIQTLAAAL